LVAQVEIISEREFQGGWAFDVQVLDDAGALSKHRVTLAWADYNLWSPDGADEPARVIEAVVQFVTSRTPAHDLAEKLDASTARRRFADADARIPQMIRRAE
jgi:hypothetical protein